MIFLTKKSLDLNHDLNCHDLNRPTLSTSPQTSTDDSFSQLLIATCTDQDIVVFWNDYPFATTSANMSGAQPSTFQ